MQKILFICTGNWYRSRLSEVLFNYYAMVGKLSWRADSRGLTETSISGISMEALAYLEQKGLHTYLDTPRDPEAIRVSDLEESDLIVVLCRSEHEGMMRERFGQIPKFMEQQGKLRYWNVFDVPIEGPTGIRSIFGAKSSRQSQPPNSSTEHIDLAVKLLIHELSENQMAVTLDPDSDNRQEA
ncbi:MAG: hypothetical protein P8L18_01965 [Verrucomicrobiota bacterium]|nr:hypothetical protein [Verrucomicrobiota bacterium]MDG1890049.1 hypothetical protein [Verrucomicrobiota bacterium]